MRADEFTRTFGTEQTLYPSAANVLAVYERSSELQREQGARWYRNEHDIGAALAEKHWRRWSPRTLRHALGIEAALSPMIDWDIAKQLTVTCYRERGLRGGHYPAFVEKANRIYFGEEPTAVLGGPKVTSFYQALLSSGMDDSVVVVDRHALHASLGEVVTARTRTRLLRQNGSVDGYQFAANAYRHAARRVRRYTPSQLQAIVWVTWRDHLLGATEPAYEEAE